MEDNRLPREDYRAIWRQLYCAIVAGRRSALDGKAIVGYAEDADKMLEEYMKRHTKFRELNLKAFK